MIRNAVLHLMNEQPLLADLLEMPTTTDVSLVCTNLRQMNGRRPIFVNDGAAVFVFPYDQVRFVELPAAEVSTRKDAHSTGPSAGATTGAEGTKAAARAPKAQPAAAPGSRALVPAGPRTDAIALGAPTFDGGNTTSMDGHGAVTSGGNGRGEPATATEAAAEDLETELELDEDFLRRVREI